MRRFGAKFCTGTFCSLSGCQKKRTIALQGAITKLGNILGELLAVVKQNNHPEFQKYLEIAKENGMNEVVLERKLNELSEIKKSFELAYK